MSKFPLIKKWFPELSVLEDNVYVSSSNLAVDYDVFNVRAADLEAALAKGSHLYWDKLDQWSKPVNETGYTFTTTCLANSDTHEALLIGQRPIVRERKRELSESEVREALEDHYCNNHRKETISDVLKALFGTDTSGGET